MPFSYGMPIEAIGPLSEVTKPTVSSAALPPPADNSTATIPMHKRERMTEPPIQICLEFKVSSVGRNSEAYCAVSWQPAQYAPAALLRPTHRRGVIRRVVVFHRVVEILGRLAIAAAQLEHGFQARHVDAALAEETVLRIEQFVVAALGQVLRHLRQVLAQDAHRLVAVGAYVKPVDRLDVGADIGDHLVLVGGGPRAPRRGDVALVVADHLGRGRELGEPV